MKHPMRPLHLRKWNFGHLRTPKLPALERPHEIRHRFVKQRDLVEEIRKIEREDAAILVDHVDRIEARDLQPLDESFENVEPVATAPEHGVEAVDDLIAGSHGLVPGNIYPLHFFFAERHTVDSNFNIETSIADPGSCD